MRLSSLADYAVVMMAAAARHCGASGRLNATLIAQETALPLPTVQKLVSKLSSAGLIESTRGTGGGFRLTRPPAAINLADIVEAIEGPIALTACVDHSRGDCAVESSCSVRPHWAVVNGAVRGALADISLASLTHNPVRPDPVEGRSFSSSAAKEGGASTSSAQTAAGVS
ncbi:SUF system Fe-S cluster assembly regulator [Stakelama pacifica]|uniref:BadM/Rrf2 family transcriptional regulator n=1 Tax=Stakelama pacifica TaxID=517720 RepID=A0A4R6FS25_9SPHN|nr:SUF system Fe-S cluster assembly regulator [Stakelama pacifica]TDN83664.1 BadM/Rrf2 family transcriptional regulator [Stakelama pacifica]GGO94464.1 transcriptional regulator [Stakelama pacifica]